MTGPFDLVHWPVHTERLTLRPAGAPDVEATWVYRRDEEVTRWMTSAPTTIQAYAEKFTDPTRLAKTLVIELDGAVIGDLMLAPEDAWSQAEVAERARGVQAEIGWCLHPGSTGNGYAGEAVTALIEVCFTDLGLRRVTASCFAGNAASCRLMERLGMRREMQTVRDSLHRSGDWLDGFGYALLADEWRARPDADAPTG